MNRLLHHVSSLLAAAVIPLFLAGIVLHVHGALADPLPESGCTSCACVSLGSQCYEGVESCGNFGVGCYCEGEEDDRYCVLYTASEPGNP